MKEPIFDKTWLVWVKPHAGPATPQVWKHDRMCSELTVVDKHELPDGAADYLSIESLAALYPARMRAQ